MDNLREQNATAGLKDQGPYQLIPYCAWRGCYLAQLEVLEKMEGSQAFGVAWDRKHSMEGDLSFDARIRPIKE